MSIDPARLRARIDHYVRDIHASNYTEIPRQDLLAFASGMTLPPEQLELLARKMGLLAAPPCNATPKARRRDGLLDLWEPIR